MNRKTVIIAICCVVAVSAAGLAIGKLKAGDDDLAWGANENCETTCHVEHWLKKTVHFLEPEHRNKLLYVLKEYFKEIATETSEDSVAILMHINCFADRESP